MNRSDVLHNTTFRNGWDTSFRYAPTEIELANKYRSETSFSIVRDNLFWARPKVRGFGGAIAFAAPLDFAFVKKDDDFIEIHGCRFLRMDPSEYDLRLRQMPADAPPNLDTGLRTAFGGLRRNPWMPGAGAWPVQAVADALER